MPAAGLLDVQVVDENALGGLRTQVDDVRAVGGGAHGRLEHQVELADIRPVAGAADGADDVVVDDDLPILGEVVGLLGGHVPVVDLIPLGLLAQDVGVRRAELGLVEGIAEALAALGDLLVDLLFDLAEEILDQDVGAIALLGVLVVDERVVEGAHVAGSLPDAGMHEDGGVDAHDVLVQAGHRFPPVILDVVLELDAHLAVIVHGGEAVINLAGGENEAVLLAVGYQHFEKFILCHITKTFVFFPDSRSSRE